MCVAVIDRSLAPARSKDALRPASTARLTVLAKVKSEHIAVITIPTALPDIRKGIRIKAN